MTEHMESSEPRYPFVAVDVALEDVDEASARLFELGAQGIEERDATTLAAGASGRVTLVASFESARDGRDAARALPPGWAPRLGEVVGDAWRDEWKKFFEPFTLAGDIVVAPPWAEARARPGQRVIVLEPGRAFGTGLHETTSLVADALVDHAPRFRERPILDVGCGSGILSLVALSLGAARARAVDVDPEAVAVARENAARNGVGDRIAADVGPLSGDPREYDMVVANIEASPLVELAPAVTASVARGGLVVLSGILAADVAPGQIESVRRGYGSLRELELRRKGEWVAVVLER